VAAQGDSSYAVMSDGSVLSWGRDSRGSLGNGASELSLQLPKPVMISSNTQLGSVISLETIIGGASPAAAALKADGSVFGWGSSDSGVIPGAKSDTYFATAIPGLPPISKLRANNGYFYALALNGSVWFWGINNTRVGQISVLPKIVYLTTIDRSTVAWAADGRRLFLDGKNITVLSN
jgi:alpha-tubulin suppressor-like RCC1 family protein